MAQISDGPRAARLPGADELIEALDPEQREVALAATGPVCVLAGAGTGKTRAITHRIAYGVRTGRYPASNVLAVTFTARAAGEMRSRLRDLGVPGVQARTFHSAAMRQLSHFWPQAIGGRPWQVVEYKAQLVAGAARRLRLSVDRVAVRDLASEIEWAKVMLVRPDDYVERAAAAGRIPPAGFSAEVIARLYTEYEELKAEQAVMDFEDVLAITAQLLADRSDIASTVRAQYRHFVVDEFQDVSPIQQRLLDQWLGDRNELCVVGDPSQTIYSFAGATPEYLLNFPQRFRGASLIKLVRDYRSTPQVVRLANDLLRAPRRGEAGYAKPLELVSQRTDGPAVRFTEYGDDEAEAAGVAARIKGLIAEGTSAGSIAVLYRTNAQSELFEGALAHAGIGYLVRGGDRFFSRKDVRDAMVLLRGAVHHAPDRAMPEVVRDTLSDVGWSTEPPAAAGAQRERWDAMQALVALADDLAATRNADMAGFVAELAERADSQHVPSVDGVTLASLHAAKGLEWDSVFLVGMSEGLMPISLAETDDAVAEERRLLYVGVTRARTHLDISYARSRRAGGRGSRKVTRFLDGLWPTPVTKPAARKVRSGKTTVAVTGDIDAELFEKLRLWRLETAAALGKPAFVVFGNVTLVAIAETRPTSIEELAAIGGVGPVKLDQFGDQVVSIVRGHMTGDAPPTSSHDREKQSSGK